MSIQKFKVIKDYYVPSGVPFLGFSKGDTVSGEIEIIDGVKGVNSKPTQAPFHDKMVFVPMEYLENYFDWSTFSIKFPKIESPKVQELKKYVFVKPYDLMSMRNPLPYERVDMRNNKLVKSFKAGDVVEGRKYESPSGIYREAPLPAQLQISIGEKNYLLPFDLVEIADSKEPTSSSQTITSKKPFFSPKNLLIGAVVVGLLFLGFKPKK